MVKASEAATHPSLKLKPSGESSAPLRWMPPPLGLLAAG